MMTALTLHIPQAAQAAIYRPGQPVKICDRPPNSCRRSRSPQLHSQSDDNLVILSQGLNAVLGSGGLISKTVELFHFWFNPENE
ncbi:MAG: hypothetical protein HC910_01190 [Spirulinaceae cyanobacterium SM2_1_0]|nr:hypothetical protein [Spirulinaceae cyanobacterium SM2_1_0]